ncbi:MAG: hypothetical protein MRY63_06435 [Neomegalonema sp.]|nr:hypothetical protein [Neomegalonema sp.]
MSRERLSQIEGQHLSPFPEHASDAAKHYAREYAVVLLRGKMLDEATWLQCQEIGVLHAQLDEVLEKMRKQGAAHKDNTVAMPKGQQQAALQNRIATMRRELLVTPRARRAAFDTAQTTFIDQLASVDDGDAGTSNVATFQPKRYDRAAIRNG